MAATLVALVAVPTVTGALLLIAGHAADRAAAPVGITAALATVGLAVAAGIGRPTFSAEYVAGVSFGAQVDGLSAVITVTVAVVSLAVLVFSAADLAPDASRARLVGLLLVFSAAMLLTVTATTLLTLLMAWEVMGATSYALIGFRWDEPRPAASGAVALLTTRTGDLGLYVAAGAALAGGAGGLELAALAALPDGWRDLVAAGVVVAALGKSAQLPFSFWLSRAMDGPSPVSALLHSAAMVAAGAYLLLRLNPLLSATEWAATLLTWVGAATALVLGAVAAVQRDLKQLLAASTCAQLGFVVLAAGAGAVAAGGAHLVTHALTKSLLFLTAGAWLTALGTDRLGDLRGVGTRWPVTGAAFAVGGATLAGLAPLSLWASKEHVLAAALHTSTPLYLTALAATALGAVYAGRATMLVLGRPRPRHGPQARRHGGANAAVRTAQQAPLVPLAAGAAGLGVLAVPGVWSAFAALTAGGPPRPEAAPQGWDYLVSAVLALGVVVAVAVVVRGRGDVLGQARPPGWLGLETAARAGVAAAVLRTAAALARFDDRVVHGGVRAIARSGQALARVTDSRGERGVEIAVRTVTDGVRVLGRLARRPQTGQLHQYYAQTVVLLAALAVLLVLTSLAWR